MNHVDSKHAQEMFWVLLLHTNETASLPSSPSASLLMYNTRVLSAYRGNPSVTGFWKKFQTADSHLISLAFSCHICVIKGVTLGALSALEFCDGFVFSLHILFISLAGFVLCGLGLWRWPLLAPASLAWCLRAEGYSVTGEAVTWLMPVLQTQTPWISERTLAS